MNNTYEVITVSPYKQMHVHRLVALKHIPNPEGKSDVNHKDGNKRNNDPSNLEWVTRAENIKHAWDTGLQTHHGENHENSKLTYEDVDDIKVLRALGWTQQRLSDMYGINQSQVSRLIRGKAWAR